MKYNFCNIIILLLFVLLQLSCSSSSSPSSNNEEDYNLGNYKSELFQINPKNVTSPLGEEQYSIDSIRSIITPDGIGDFEITKVFVNDEKIYILDSDVAQTILIFNLSGQFLYKLGEIGRAKNEYISGPKDFFVANNGDVHVLDDGGHKILIFDNKGQFLKNVDAGWTHSFGLTTNEKYLCCLDNRDLPDEKPDPSLFVYDIKSGTKKNLIPSKHFQCYLVPNHRTFFYNDGNLSHVPLLSDSVIVFKNDVPEKVVRFDFEGSFLPKDKPEWVRIPDDDSKPVKATAGIARYPGVFAIYDYQETESLILMRYLKLLGKVSWLYDKRTKQIVHSDKLFAGFNVFSECYLRGDQIIAYVGKENVEMLKEYCKSEEFDKEEYKKAPSFVKAFQSGKLFAPALVYITIK